MNKKIFLLPILMTVIVILLPSTVFSELKEITNEYCDVYSGDLKNKKSFDEFKKTVSEKAKENGLKKIFKEFRSPNIISDCIRNVINNYLEKVEVLRHTERTEENGKKICEKVKITFNPKAISKYLSQESCLKDWGKADKEFFDWCHDIDVVIPAKKEKLNIGLIIETKIPKINVHKKDVLEKEEEKQFWEMVEINKDKYNLIDKSSFIKVAKEQKIPLYGITDNDIFQLGKLLNLDVIVHRIISKSSRITKVRKISTGKVLLFTAYETGSDLSEPEEPGTKVSETKTSEWVKYGKDKSGTLHFYKKGDVNKDGNIVKVLNKWVFSKREISGAIQYRRDNRSSTKGYHKLSHMIYLSEIDCPNQSERILYIFVYDTDEKLLYSHNFRNPEWSFIKPESNGETILKAVCK